MITINGRQYPLWSQFVERKEEWIGGTLIEINLDPHIKADQIKTEITNIELVPNGFDSAFFKVCGKDFFCGFDVRYGGVSGADTNRFPEGFTPFGTTGQFPLLFGIKGSE